MNQNQYCPLHYLDHKPENYTKILLFIHGNLVNSKCWSRLTAAIAAKNPKLRMICPDLRSFGKSQTVSNYDSMQELAGDVIQLLQVKLIQEENIPLSSLKSNLITIGWSLGGAVTMRLAIDYPEYVKRIVLVSSSGVCGIPILHVNDPTWRCQSKKEIQEQFGEGIMNKILETKNKEELTVLFQKTLFREQQGQEILDELVEQAFSQQNYLDSLNALNTFDISAAKENKGKTIEGPVLIYHGKLDAVVNSIQAEGIAKEIGEEKCKLIIREDVGHAPVYENVEDLMNVILEFIE